MLHLHRQHYLQAMGITAWQMRTDTAVATPPTANTHPDSNTTERLTTTKLRTTSGWLIWLGDAVSQNHWAPILKDLQALCISTQLNNPSAAIITSQPKELLETTGVLAIGLPEEQLAWLKSNGNYLIQLPPISTWHNQPTVKQQLWHTLQEQLW